MMRIADVTILLSTGILAGISNAIAGGGTFFKFPAFIRAGVPPVMANASNAVAGLGHAFAAAAYRCRGRLESEHLLLHPVLRARQTSRLTQKRFGAQFLLQRLSCEECHAG